MKINSITKNNVQNNNPNFNARLQLSGNIKLLNTENIKSLKSTVENIGAKSDIIAINLPETLKNKTVIGFAGLINGVIVQFVEKFDKNNELTTCLTNGLNNIKETVGSLPVIKSELDDDFIMTKEEIKEVLCRLKDAIYNNDMRSFKEILKIKSTNFINKIINGSLGWSAIHLLVHYDFPAGISEIAKRPDLDVNAQDYEGRTALHLAVMKNMPLSSEELLKIEDINLEIKDDQGKIPEQYIKSDMMKEVFEEYKKSKLNKENNK